MTSEIGERIKKARRKLGLTQSEFAALCHVTDKRTVRRWETGEREPSGAVIALIELALTTRRK